MRAWPRQVIFVHRLLAAVIAGFTALLLATLGEWPLAPLGVAAGLGYYYVSTRKYRARRRLVATPMKPEWRAILEQRVDYFRRLGPEGRRRFEDDVRIFIAEQRIIAEKGAVVDDETRVLIAAGAAMLGHGLPDWEWSAVRDILVYPRAFDDEYRADRHRVYSGKVHQQGPAVLSREDVLRGFEPGSTENLVLHELAHVMDFADGRADGAPPDVEVSSPLPWFSIMANRLARVRERRDNEVLRDYAGENEAELFAVAVETFFAEPGRLQANDPTLYRMLAAWFVQDPASGEPFPGRPKRIAPLDPGSEPWVPRFVYSDVSGDPKARELASATAPVRRELEARGFVSLGCMRAVLVDNPAIQLFSGVLASEDRVVLAAITPSQGKLPYDLVTLFDDGSVVTTASLPGLRYFVYALPMMRQHPDDDHDFETARGSPGDVLARHRERVAVFERVRGTHPVAAISIQTYLGVRLRSAELRDSRLPAERKIARRAALIGSALIAAAIWAPFLARIPTPESHLSPPESSVAVGPAGPLPVNRAVQIANLGLGLALFVAFFAYGPLVRLARPQIGARITRLRPGPPKIPAVELLHRAERAGAAMTSPSRRSGVNTSSIDA